MYNEPHSSQFITMSFYNKNVEISSNFYQEKYKTL